MKKLILIALLFPVITYSAQNFNSAKTKLTKLYKANTTQKEFYCGCDFSYQGKKGVVDLKSCGYQVRKNENRAKRIEWEHVMPAENFGRQFSCWKNGGRKACKKDQNYNTIEGDMHNLQPAIGEVNGDRSNYQYAQRTNEPYLYGQCKSTVNFKAKRFYPRDEIKGTIARTYLYMEDKYKIELSKHTKQLINAWDKMYPPSKWECERNKIIKGLQGNDNKFITSQCH